MLLDYSERAQNRQVVGARISCFKYSSCERRGGRLRNSKVKRRSIGRRSARVPCCRAFRSLMNAAFNGIFFVLHNSRWREMINLRAAFSRHLSCPRREARRVPIDARRSTRADHRRAPIIDASFDAYYC